jgi:hypothetical protein
MSLELTLSFAAIDRVTVELDNRRTNSIPFTSPFAKEDWEQIELELSDWFLPAWYQAGATRLLLTTRESELNHADYPTVNSRRHQLLSLSGLGNERHPEDALGYFQGLMKLPPAPKWDLPKREALIDTIVRTCPHPQLTDRWRSLP